MKKKSFKKWYLILFLVLLCNVSFAQQRTTYNINLTSGSLTFKSDKSVYQGSTFIATHSNDNVYVITTNGVATTNTITIETVNLVPTDTSGGVPIAANEGMIYNITLDNVYIDRSGEPNPHETNANLYDGHYCGLHYGNWSGVVSKYNEGTRMPFNAGDDTVEVNITLVGTNIIKGEPGANAALQYVSVDNGGIVGDKSLTIQESGSASLTISKDGSMNAGAAIGTPMCGASNSVNVKNGSIIINSGTITASTGSYVVDPPTPPGEPIPNNSWAGSYAAAIGGGACNRGGDITINGGTITATSNATAAAIGAGGGHTAIGAPLVGTIRITGGTVETYSKGNHLVANTGVGIGGGSADQNGGGGAYKIEISGGSVTAWKWIWSGSYSSGSWVKGDIGGGNSNIEHGGGTNSKGGDADVEITGGTINAGNIGGGSGSQPGAAGGNATLYVDMASGGVNLTGTIGGGNSVYDNGGNSDITIVKGTVTAGSIGGGNSTSDGTILVDPNDPSAGYGPMTTGNGGTTSVFVQGGNLTVTGKIGGGSSAGSGNGGNASIHVTGGILDCGSIGGGDSNLGAPGAVAHDPDTITGDPIAGVRIEGGTLTSGYIGGGINTAGDIGKATAYITGGTIQGQFILCNNTSTVDDHSYFIMTDGTIDNTNLGAIGATSHPRIMAEGGAVYMEDANGEVRISGGTIQNSTGTLGGAVYMTNGSFRLSGNTAIKDCTATKVGDTKGQGGAIYMGGGTFTMTGGSIGEEDHPNSAENMGGGFCVNGGTVSVEGGVIEYNTATVAGGGFYVDAANTSDTTFIKGGAKLEHNTAVNGGGAYINNGQLKVSGSATSISSNKATTSGGGIYMVNGTVLFNDAKLEADSAQCGGGFYIGNGDVIIKDATIRNNVSTVSHGGAFDIANGDLTVTNSSITGNKAPAGNGGGAYVGNGSVTFNTGTTVTNNTAIDGGGICVNGGSITYNAGTIDNNTATRNGGGIYAGSNVSFVGGTVSNNKAVNGGGMYSNAGTVEFSSGTFSGNEASQRGGGIYIKDGATLTMTGNATVTANHVPAECEGGGVYLGGTFNVGDGTTGHTLKIEDNYAGTATSLNNVFLPSDDEYITLLSDISADDGAGHYLSHIGFSVNSGFRRVVYAATAHEEWLYRLMGSTSTLTSAIFDDAQKYIAVHLREDRAPFENEYIYLWGCWTTAVTSNPGNSHIELEVVGSDSTYHIKSNQGLAWFTSLVNGLNRGPAPQNTFTAPQPTLKAVLEADVNMGDYLWVPIGGVGKYKGFNPAEMSSIFEAGGEYKGEFDGQGHTVSGLDCRYITSIQTYGLFGNMTGGEVKSTFVKDYSFYTEDATISYNIGGIAGHMTAGTVSGCEAEGEVTATICGDATAVGGLVGLAEGTAAVHSSIAMPAIAYGATAPYIGGLVGKLSGGASLKNSFANASYPDLADGTLGGLVGYNAGTVENCYSHLQDDPATDLHFGWLVGTNAAGGQVNYCYSPVNGSYYYGTNSGTLTGYGHYADDTRVPYLYARRDNQVTLAETGNPYYPAENGSDANPDIIASDKQMVLCLEHWVDTMNLKHGGHYAHWNRPTTKTINNDLPLLLMTGFDAVAATDSDPFIAYGLVNTLLGSYKSATQAVWLYRNKEGLAGNGSSSAKFYIAEGVSVIPSATVNAYVGVTLDNSAGSKGANPTFGDIVDYTDWHMFSSPLVSAPLGIHYTDDTQWGTQFSYEHPTGMPYYRFYDDDANHGYFPSMTYEWAKTHAYSADNSTIDGNGNYYKEWDFYTYYEPEYHWINFKRNSNSHWHEDIQDLKINYSNETNLKQGRGYLAATREETFLQCHGQLTDGEVTIPVTRDGYYSTGYNLLGNPYPSYLNFDEFARVNKVLWGGGTDADFTASYAVIDEDGGGYIYRAIRCSANPNTAPQYIAPHQGFMILAASAGTATFDNTMRDLDGDGGHFRGEEQPAYPLVNLIATDDSGNRDIATVELGRPDKGGAPLMRELKLATCHVYSRYDDEDWAIAFTQPGISEVPVRFEAYADGEYTMRWNTQNGEFSYLHLIDNQTGADINCLATDEYRFVSTTTDYKSRFRLVFGYTGIEEPEGGEPAQGSFAYQSGDELVVTGEGTVELFDVTGRRMSAERIEGVQGTVSVSGLMSGVYLLRLATATGTRVQKIVINQ